MTSQPFRKSMAKVVLMSAAAEATSAIITNQFGIHGSSNSNTFMAAVIAAPSWQQQKQYIHSSSNSNTFMAAAKTIHSWQQQKQFIPGSSNSNTFLAAATLMPPRQQ